MTDMDKQARIGAVYNIFAYAMLFPTILIIPRMVDSLHRGEWAIRRWIPRISTRGWKWSSGRVRYRAGRCLAYG